MLFRNMLNKFIDDLEFNDFTKGYITAVLFKALYEDDFLSILREEGDLKEVLGLNPVVDNTDSFMYKENWAEHKYSDELNTLFMGDAPVSIDKKGDLNEISHTIQ